MAFTVQDDNGSVSGANSYATVAEASAYFSDRGILSWASVANKEAALVLATDYLDERFNYIGERLNVDQATEWPRYNAYDRDDNYVEGIPTEVKEAVFEYALLAASQDLNPTPDRDDTGRKVQSKSEMVGPISESVTFTSGAVFELPKYPKADRKLIARGLVVRGGRILRG